MKRSIALFALMSLFALSGLRAEDATGRLGLGGAFGLDDAYARKVLRRGTDADVFGSAWLRFGFSQKNELALAYDNLQLKPKGAAAAGRSIVQPVTLNLWHSVSPDRRLTPFWVVGAGVADLRRMDVSRRTGLALQAGGGLEYFVCRGFSLGALVRAHYVANRHSNGTTEGTLLSAGLMANLFWPAGPAKAAEAAPVVRSAPVEKPLAAAPAPDADGDGVADALDQCPGTGRGVAVNASGCPRDSDNDGVIDNDDKCPDTPAGQLVNADGCPAETVSVNLDIKFDPGQAVVKPEFDAAIKKVADFLARFPGTTVVIEGHTDNAGNPATSQPLSQRRADAVRKVLVEKFAVDGARVSAKGFGDTKPVADNATAAGRAQNRRVVATVSAVKK